MSIVAPVLTLLWCLLLLPFFIWVGVLLLQSVCAALSVPPLLLLSRRPRVAILIPAHNEAAGIGRTLASLLPQLQAGDRLLVVADNCDDDTAQAAAAAGADVVERHDALLRGKGYALDHGVRHLGHDAHDVPEVVIVVDADCIVEADAVDCLSRACKAYERPMQALYLMRSPAAAAVGLGQLREFAWVVRNLVRPLGYLRLGQPCQLMGTGMAFPWPLLASAQQSHALANAHLVEDMKLGIDFARHRAAPLFCPQALVSSEFPVAKAGSDQQRRRWEHGHLGMIAAVPVLLGEAVRKRNLDLLAMAIDMSVPPLALLVLAMLGLIAFSAAVAPPPVLGAALLLPILLLAAIGIGWWCHGRQVVKLRALMLAPFYALRKIPLYFGFLRRRQVEWVRSSRE